MAIAENLGAQVEALALCVDKLERENKILREENAMLKKYRFGRSSERLEPGQSTFFETGEWPVPEPSTLQPATSERKPKQPTKGHGRSAFPDHLEREVHHHELPEDERKCSTCSTLMQPIGEDVTERGRFIPAHIIVDRDVRTKYGCPHGHEIKTAALPAGVIAGGKYDASVYANIVTAKYQDHIPINRLEGIYKRYGFRIAKQTMWDMFVTVDELLAQPVLKQMHLELLKEPILHADETPVTLRVEGQKASRKGWVWGWRNEPGERPSKVLIEFHLDRSKQVPSTFLGDWVGILLTDGFASYKSTCEVNGITRAGCWAHARRYFREALESGAREAAPIFNMVNRLFALERGVKRRAERLQLGFAEALELRAVTRERYSAKLIARMLEAATELERKHTTLPKSRLGKALTYLLNQQQPLSTFLQEPRLPIHNNDEERDLRHVIIGRNNWMVFASVRGGQVACRLYSLMLSCKQNGVNPEAYIADVLMVLAKNPDADIASLTPWAWGQAQLAEAEVR